MNEALWRKAEANQLMREARDRIKSGMIQVRSKPNVLILNDKKEWRFPPISRKSI